ncbi:MAG: winged helix-turn-helix domain-containing protein [Balneolaceae bacterium]
MNNLDNKNSALKTPLDDILGSKGHIMILRQLAEAENPMSHSELLDRTSLSRQGVYDIVRRLIENGIISYVGSGKQQQVQLRQEYHLTDIITKLFKAEKKRFEDLIQRLKKEIKNLEIKPKSAWIFGKVAQGIDQYGDSLCVAMMGEVRTVDQIVEDLRSQIYETEIEKQFDVTIEISGVTLADFESRPIFNTNMIILLWGPDPQHFLVGSKDERTGKRTHQDLDKQSLIDSKAWTELLKTHPEIIQRTIEYLEERIPQIRSGEKNELKEWKHILESMSFQRLKKFLQSDSERSTRLRQSLPFWPVLNNNERAKLEKIKSEQLQVHE